MNLVRLGANNGVYPNVGMPNVLLHLQGVQRYDQNRCKLSVEPGTGSLTAEEFDQVIMIFRISYTTSANRIDLSGSV